MTWQTITVIYKDGSSERLDTGDNDAAEVAIMGSKLDPRTREIIQQFEGQPAKVIFRADAGTQP